MTWAQLIPLLVQYGIEGAYRVWRIIQEHPEPTEEAWAKLLALALKPMAHYEKEAQERAGGASPTPPLSTPSFS